MFRSPLKNYLVEFPDHLPRPEFTQVASTLPRGTGRILLRYLSEVGTYLDFIFQLFALLFTVDQYMPGACFGHSGPPFQLVLVNLQMIASRTHVIRPDQRKRTWFLRLCYLKSGKSAKKPRQTTGVSSG